MYKLLCRSLSKSHKSLTSLNSSYKIVTQSYQGTWGKRFVSDTELYRKQQVKDAEKPEQSCEATENEIATDAQTPSSSSFFNWKHRISGTETVPRSSSFACCRKHIVSAEGIPENVQCIPTPARYFHTSPIPHNSYPTSPPKKRPFKNKQAAELYRTAFAQCMRIKSKFDKINRRFSWVPRQFKQNTWNDDAEPEAEVSSESLITPRKIIYTPMQTRSSAKYNVPEINDISRMRDRAIYQFKSKNIKITYPTHCVKYKLAFSKPHDIRQVKSGYPKRAKVNRITVPYAQNFISKYSQANNQPNLALIVKYNSENRKQFDLQRQARQAAEETEEQPEEYKQIKRYPTVGKVSTAARMPIGGKHIKFLKKSQYRQRQPQPQIEEKPSDEERLSAQDEQQPINEAAFQLKSTNMSNVEQLQEGQESVNKTVETQANPYIAAKNPIGLLWEKDTTLDIESICMKSNENSTSNTKYRDNVVEVNQLGDAAETKIVQVLNPKVAEDKAATVTEEKKNVEVEEEVKAEECPPTAVESIGEYLKQLRIYKNQTAVERSLLRNTEEMKRPTLVQKVEVPKNKEVPMGIQVVKEQKEVQKNIAPSKKVLQQPIISSKKSIIAAKPLYKIKVIPKRIQDPVLVRDQNKVEKLIEQPKKVEEQPIDSSKHFATIAEKPPSNIPKIIQHPVLVKEHNVVEKIIDPPKMRAQEHIKPSKHFTTRGAKPPSNIKEQKEVETIIEPPKKSDPDAKTVKLNSLKTIRSPLTNMDRVRYPQMKRHKSEEPRKIVYPKMENASLVGKNFTENSAVGLRAKSEQPSSIAPPSSSESEVASSSVKNRRFRLDNFVTRQPPDDSKSGWTRESYTRHCKGTKQKRSIENLRKVMNQYQVRTEEAVKVQRKDPDEINEIIKQTSELKKINKRKRREAGSNFDQKSIVEPGESKPKVEDQGSLPVEEEEELSGRIKPEVAIKPQLKERKDLRRDMYQLHLEQAPSPTENKPILMEQPPSQNLEEKDKKSDVILNTLGEHLADVTASTGLHADSNPTWDSIQIAEEKEDKDKDKKPENILPKEKEKKPNTLETRAQLTSEKLETFYIEKENKRAVASQEIKLQQTLTEEKDAILNNMKEHVDDAKFDELEENRVKLEAKTELTSEQGDTEQKLETKSEEYEVKLQKLLPIITQGSVEKENIAEERQQKVKSEEQVMANSEPTSEKVEAKQMQSKQVANMQVYLEGCIEKVVKQLKDSTPKTPEDAKISLEQILPEEKEAKCDKLSKTGHSDQAKLEVSPARRKGELDIAKKPESKLPKLKEKGEFAAATAESTRVPVLPEEKYANRNKLDLTKTGHSNWAKIKVIPAREKAEPEAATRPESKLPKLKPVHTQSYAEKVLTQEKLSDKRKFAAANPESSQVQVLTVEKEAQRDKLVLTKTEDSSREKVGVKPAREKAEPEVAKKTDYKLLKLKPVHTQSYFEKVSTQEKLPDKRKFPAATPESIRVQVLKKEGEKEAQHNILDPTKTEDLNRAKVEVLTEGKEAKRNKSEHPIREESGANVERYVQKPVSRLQESKSIQLHQSYVEKMKMQQNYVKMKSAGLKITEPVKNKPHELRSDTQKTDKPKISGLEDRPMIRRDRPEPPPKGKVKKDKPKTKNDMILPSKGKNDPKTMMDQPSLAAPGQDVIMEINNQLILKPSDNCKVMKVEGTQGESLAKLAEEQRDMLLKEIDQNWEEANSDKEKPEAYKNNSLEDESGIPGFLDFGMNKRKYAKEYGMPKLEYLKETAATGKTEESVKDNFTTKENIQIFKDGHYQPKPTSLVHASILNKQPKVIGSPGSFKTANLAPLDKEPVTQKPRVFKEENIALLDKSATFDLPKLDRGDEAQKKDEHTEKFEENERYEEPYSTDSCFSKISRVKIEEDSGYKVSATQPTIPAEMGSAQPTTAEEKDMPKNEESALLIRENEPEIPKKPVTKHIKKWELEKVPTCQAVGTLGLEKSFPETIEEAPKATANVEKEEDTVLRTLKKNHLKTTVKCKEANVKAKLGAKEGNLKAVNKTHGFEKFIELTPPASERQKESNAKGKKLDNVKTLKKGETTGSEVPGKKTNVKLRLSRDSLASKNARKQKHITAPKRKSAEQKKYVKKATLSLSRFTLFDEILKEPKNKENPSENGGKWLEINVDGGRERERQRDTTHLDTPQNTNFEASTAYFAEQDSKRVARGKKIRIPRSELDLPPTSTPRKPKTRLCQKNVYLSRYDSKSSTSSARGKISRVGKSKPRIITKTPLPDTPQPIKQQPQAPRAQILAPSRVSPTEEIPSATKPVIQEAQASKTTEPGTIKKPHIHHHVPSRKPEYARNNPEPENMRIPSTTQPVTQEPQASKTQILATSRVFPTKKIPTTIEKPHIHHHVPARKPEYARTNPEPENIRRNPILEWEKREALNVTQKAVASKKKVEPIPETLIKPRVLTTRTLHRISPEATVGASGKTYKTTTPSDNDQKSNSHVIIKSEKISEKTSPVESRKTVSIPRKRDDDQEVIQKQEGEKSSLIKTIQAEGTTKKIIAPKPKEEETLAPHVDRQMVGSNTRCYLGVLHVLKKLELQMTKEIIKMLAEGIATNKTEVLDQEQIDVIAKMTAHEEHILKELEEKLTPRETLVQSKAICGESAENMEVREFAKQKLVVPKKASLSELIASEEEKKLKPAPMLPDQEITTPEEYKTSRGKLVQYQPTEKESACKTEGILKQKVELIASGIEDTSRGKSLVRYKPNLGEQTADKIQEKSDLNVVDVRETTTPEEYQTSREKLVQYQPTIGEESACKTEGILKQIASGMEDTSRGKSLVRYKPNLGKQTADKIQEKSDLNIVDVRETTTPEEYQTSREKLVQYQPTEKESPCKTEGILKQKVEQIASGMEDTSRGKSLVRYKPNLGEQTADKIQEKWELNVVDVRETTTPEEYQTSRGKLVQYQPTIREESACKTEGILKQKVEQIASGMEDTSRGKSADKIQEKLELNVADVKHAAAEQTVDETKDTSRGRLLVEYKPNIGEQIVHKIEDKLKQSLVDEKYAAEQILDETENISRRLIVQYKPNIEEQTAYKIEPKVKQNLADEKYSIEEQIMEEIYDVLRDEVQKLKENLVEEKYTVGEIIVDEIENTSRGKQYKPIAGEQIKFKTEENMNQVLREKLYRVEDRTKEQAVRELEGTLKEELAEEKYNVKEQISDKVKGTPRGKIIVYNQPSLEEEIAFEIISRLSVEYQPSLGAQTVNKIEEKDDAMEPILKNLEQSSKRKVVVEKEDSLEEKSNKKIEEDLFKIDLKENLLRQYDTSLEKQMMADMKYTPKQQLLVEERAVGEYQGESKSTIPVKDPELITNVKDLLHHLDLHKYETSLEEQMMTNIKGRPKQQLLVEEKVARQTPATTKTEEKAAGEYQAARKLGASKSDTLVKDPAPITDNVKDLQWLQQMKGKIQRKKPVLPKPTFLLECAKEKEDAQQHNATAKNLDKVRKRYREKFLEDIQSEAFYLVKQQQATTDVEAKLRNENDPTYDIFNKESTAKGEFLLECAADHEQKVIDKKIDKLRKSYLEKCLDTPRSESFLQSKKEQAAKDVKNVKMKTLEEARKRALPKLLQAPKPRPKTALAIIRSTYETDKPFKSKIRSSEKLEGSTQLARKDRNADAKMFSKKQLTEKTINLSDNKPKRLISSKHTDEPLPNDSKHCTVVPDCSLEQRKPQKCRLSDQQLPSFYTFSIEKNKTEMRSSKKNHKKYADKDVTMSQEACLKKLQAISPDLQQNAKPGDKKKPDMIAKIEKILKTDYNPEEKLSKFNKNLLKNMEPQSKVTPYWPPDSQLLIPGDKKGEESTAQLANEQSPSMQNVTYVIEKTLPSRYTGVKPKSGKPVRQPCDRLCLPTKCMQEVALKPSLDELTTLNKAVTSQKITGAALVPPDPLEKYKHLKITQMRVRRKRQSEENFLPAMLIVKNKDGEGGSTLRADKRPNLKELMELRYEMLKKLYEEFCEHQEQESRRDKGSLRVVPKHDMKDPIREKPTGKSVTLHKKANRAKFNAAQVDEANSNVGSTYKEPKITVIAKNLSRQDAGDEKGAKNKSVLSKNKDQPGDGKK